MKKGNILIGLLVIMTMLTSCSAIEGVFKAGMWTTVIIIVVVIAIILFIISRFSGGNKN